MQTHEEIMNVYFVLKDELKRKEDFRKNIDNTLQEFEYYSIKNMIFLEEKSDIVMNDILLDVVKKSLSKTQLYYYIEKEELKLITELINDDFQYKYYHINNYNNVLLDFSFKFWSVTPETEKVMSLLIKKAIEYSKEETYSTLEKIKEWRNTWKDFIDKQILFYNLNENLSIKGTNVNKRKI